jgi:hypothetical protein
MRQVMRQDYLTGLSNRITFRISHTSHACTVFRNTSHRERSYSVDYIVNYPCRFRTTPSRKGV